MALTIWNQPNSKDQFSTPVYPHENTGKLAVIFYNDTLYNQYSDYNYYIEIENYKEDKKYKNIVPPLKNTNSMSGLSYLDVIKTVKSSVWYEYNPNTTNIISSPEHLAKYKISVYDYYDSTIQPTSTSAYAIVGNQTLSVFNEGDVDQVDILEYMCNSEDSKLLTYNEGVQKFQASDYATWKTYNNNFQAVGTNNPNINYVEYKITKTNGDVYTGIKTNDVSFTSGDNDLSNATIEIPIGPANINSLYITELELPNGFKYYPNSDIDLNLECGDTYTITTKDSSSASTSKSYQFEIYDGLEDNLISWENDFGGTDYQNFSIIAKKEITTKKKTYSKSKMGWYADPYSHEDTLLGRTKKRADTVYYDKYREVYTYTTEHLSPGELTKIENLFYSKNIEVCIDGKWYAGLNLKKKTNILKNNQIKHKYYTFELEVDKNKELI